MTREVEEDDDEDTGDDFVAIIGYGVVMDGFACVGEGEDIEDDAFDTILETLAKAHPKVDIYAITNFGTGDPQFVFAYKGAFPEDTFDSSQYLTFPALVERPEWSAVIKAAVKGLGEAHESLAKALKTRPTEPSYFVVFDEIEDDETDEDEEE